MSYYIIIRESRPSDLPKIAEVIRNAYLSNVVPSFLNALTREFTLQLIVTCAAILFIFMGVPLKFCFIAIPVLLGVLFIIYSAFYIKSAELINKRPLQCWVAEACQPFFTEEQSPKAQYKIIHENHPELEVIDLGNLSRRIVGTIAVSNYNLLDDSAWLFRLAVDKQVRHKGIGHSLVEVAKTWCKQKNYQRILLAISECQENTRQMFVTTGFNMKQMYHKQLIGQVFTLLMYQLECDLNRYEHDL
ncbi:LOW QUALITY PROTEIN: uncharacterized protein [Atheta coriaria]|uniref:LOW QUALITY PROTEIN: uncharacterized protein n=1 Tax=Dalotia coriaria TaxID=877792 RepID=UPI0031F38E53